MNDKPKVLAVYYTQSGQMERIIRRFCSPMEAGCEITFLRLEPVTPFPFPWSAFRFFNAFPDTFFERPIPLHAIPESAMQQFDLVILGYQPWFLSPSLVMSSFLQSAYAHQWLKDTPVITLIGARNMWLHGQEKVKANLQKIGTRIVGNVALVDHSSNIVSLLTILRWLLWGKQEASWGLPAAGVSTSDVDGMDKYGQMTLSAVKQGDWTNLQTTFNQAGAVSILPNLVMMEQRGQRAFGIWARFIGGAPEGTLSRRLRVYLFMVLLPTVVILLTPVLAIVSFLMLRLRREYLAEQVRYFSRNDLNR